MTAFASRFQWRLFPIQAGILITFALVPIWYRFPQPAPLFRSFRLFYSLDFLIFWPMLFTVVWWLIARAPGLKSLWHDRLRLLWASMLIVLAVWSVLSWTWSYTRVFRPEVTISSAIPLVLAALFALVISCAGPPLRTLIAVLVIGLVLNGAIAFLQVAKQGPVDLTVLGEFNIDPSKSGVVVVEANGIRWLRPYGLLPHPNILAGYLMIGLFSVLTWVMSKRVGVWLAGTVIFLFGLWCLLLTFSRGAWLGFGAGSLAVLPLLWRVRLRDPDARFSFISTIILSLVAAGVFVMVFRPFVSARTGEGSESVELRSISDRTVYNAFAYKAISESPILGVGIGNFPWIVSKYLDDTDFDLRGQPAHHVFLSAWAELGIIGFLLTAVMMIVGVEVILRHFRSYPRLLFSRAAELHEALNRDPDASARVVLLGALIGLMMIGLLDHYPWTLLQFQAAWWGLLAAAGKPADQPSTQITREDTLS